MDNRSKTIWAELERATAEYLQAKHAFEQAQILFESAKEKFSGIKRLASEILDPVSLFQWQQSHPVVQYAGMSIGDVILAVLRGRALSSDKAEMMLHEIVETLNAGGFEFKTPSPLREVNAALINLEGVEKTKFGYKISENDAIVKLVKTVLEGVKTVTKK